MKRWGLEPLMAANMTMLVLVFLLLVVVGIVWIVMSVQDQRRTAMAARIETVLLAPTTKDLDLPLEPSRDGLDRRISRLMQSLPANMGKKLEAASATTGGKVTPAKVLLVCVI